MNAPLLFLAYKSEVPRQHVLRPTHLEVQVSNPAEANIEEACYDEGAQAAPHNAQAQDAADVGEEQLRSACSKVPS
jgi:hypothetical protein